MTTLATGPVKYANVNESTAASNEIVAAVADKRIRILGGLLVNNSGLSDVVVTLEDEDGNNLIGPITLSANDQVVLPVNGIGYGETPVAKALHLLQDGTESVAGSITYQEVK